MDKTIVEMQRDIEAWKDIVEQDILSGNPFIVLSSQQNYWNLKNLNEAIIRLESYKKGYSAATKDILDKLLKHLYIDRNEVEMIYISVKQLKKELAAEAVTK